MAASRIALVTGGNRGLGRSIVESLYASGVSVVFTYHSHGEEAEALQDELAQREPEEDRPSPRIAAIALDTTATASFAEFATTLRRTLTQHFERDSLDILVNNAGFAGQTSLGSTEEEVLDGLFNVHVKGVYMLTQTLISSDAQDQPFPLLADGARIVNISSGLARFVTAPYAGYAAMKGAVEVLTRYWAQELGARGISVNTVAPGPVATDFGGGYLRDSDEAQRQIAGMTAQGRIAHAEDIGPAVAALVDPRTHWITGQRIEASGGFRL